MTSYTDAPSTIRQRPTMDSLFARLVDILEFESTSARVLENIADEVCGPTPADEVANRDYPTNGNLDRMMQMLDVIGVHQQRTRSAAGRLGSVLISTEKSGVASAGSSLGGAIKAAY